MNNQPTKNTTENTRKASPQPVYEVDFKLLDLVELLQNIKVSSQLAKLNETSMSDNNGGRIIL